MAWSALTSNGVSLTVSLPPAGAGAGATGGCWVFAVVWSAGGVAAAGGVVSAVWAQREAGIRAAASRTAWAGRTAAFLFILNARSRFIGSVLDLASDADGRAFLRAECKSEAG